MEVATWAGRGAAAETRRTEKNARNSAQPRTVHGDKLPPVIQYSNTSWSGPRGYARLTGGPLPGTPYALKLATGDASHRSAAVKAVRAREHGMAQRCGDQERCRAGTDRLLREDAVVRARATIGARFDTTGWLCARLSG